MEDAKNRFSKTMQHEKMSNEKYLMLSAEALKKRDADEKIKTLA